jgi:inner membrane protein
MDSVTQAVLGASIAGACAPRGQRRKALLAGAALGTLPDLDVFIDFGGAVENFTFHRGFSHSLFVLAPFSLLLWLALKRWWAPARTAPLPWLAAISLVLLTHPLLDAHTAYGTQLFWPLSVPPTSWATLFIIDPLYTLPLLVGVVLATALPARQLSDFGLRVGLALSTLYLGWSWVAQGAAARHAEAALADAGFEQAPMFITPTPFNTLLWRVVVRTDDGYLEGFDSLLLNEDGLEFEVYSSDTRALNEAGNVWAVKRLRWFARDFVRADVENDRLVISDLRMGQEPHYVFRHVVAERGNPSWRPVPSELLPFSIDQRALGAVWQRLWAEGN